MRRRRKAFDTMTLAGETVWQAGNFVVGLRSLPVRFA